MNLREKKEDTSIEQWQSLV